MSPQSRAGGLAMRRLRPGGAAVLGYLLLAGVFMFSGCADRLILFPTNSPMPAPGAQRLVVDSPAGEIEVWRFRGRGEGEPAAYVLAFGGNADRAESFGFAEVVQWSGLDVEVWAVNYPGYGGSAGPARLADIPSAALRVFDRLAATAGRTPVFVSGTSLGSAAALHVAAQREVAGVVLCNPVPLRRIILGRFGWWNLWLIAAPVAASVPAEMEAVRSAGRCRAPTVIFSAQADEVVPAFYHRKVIEACAGPTRVVAMPGASHNDLPSSVAGEAAAEAIRWLWEQSRAGR